MTSMSEWGMCVANGCPLFGTLGSGGDWFCFCHIGRLPGANDAITHCLRNSEQPVVDLTLAIRRDSLRGKSDHTAAALPALRQHPQARELAFKREVDGNARGWLLRLERHLIDATAEYGEQQGLTGLVPTAPIIGPTHAVAHYTETDK